MSKMKWYYGQLGAHTHVRVFLDGMNCGDLVFDNLEFADLRVQLREVVEFFAE